MTCAYVAMNGNLRKLIAAMDRAHAKIKRLKQRRARKKAKP